MPTLSNHIAQDAGALVAVAVFALSMVNAYALMNAVMGWQGYSIPLAIF